MDPNKSVQIEMPEWMVTQIALAAAYLLSHSAKLNQAMYTP